jgi:hypothetical protein
MQNKGYVERKEKRNLEYFQWLVRYQIQGWSAKEISDHYSKGEKLISEDAVSKALHHAALLDGFKLREK